MTQKVASRVEQWKRRRSSTDQNQEKHKTRTTIVAHKLCAFLWCPSMYALAPGYFLLPSSFSRFSLSFSRVRITQLVHFRDISGRILFYATAFLFFRRSVYATFFSSRIAIEFIRGASKKFPQTKIPSERERERVTYCSSLCLVALTLRMIFQLTMKQLHRE